MPLYALDGVAPILPADGTYWIAPDATVVGAVEIEAEVSIWFGAVVRGDNDRIFIGARSNVQDSCLLHVDRGYPLEIGEGCTLGHHSIVHGCTVGDNTLIGMGATVMNGVEIGANCLVGANSLLTERKVFPANSLIMGAPARVIRELNEKELGQLRQTAALYVANARHYARGLELLRSEKTVAIKA